MMLSPVSRPSSLSAAERPGAMLSTEPPPEGITKASASMFLSSPRSWQPSQLLDQEATKVAGCGMQPTKGGGRHGSSAVRSRCREAAAEPNELVELPGCCTVAVLA